MPQLASVVIPCYRQAQYLSDAVDSALAQTHPHVEVIVVNDGSDDATETVARSYGDRIRYVWQENRGLSGARNAGLAAAVGDCIQFLDADDVIDPTKIARQLAALETAPGTAVCISGCRQVHRETGARWPSLNVALGRDPLESLLCRWEKPVCVPIHAALFRRDAWRSGSPFDERLSAREDWVMWVLLARDGARFCYVHDELAEYRVGDGGMCRDWERMCHALIDAAGILRPVVPERLHAAFDDHVVHMLQQRLRGGLLHQASDYRELYHEATMQIQQRDRSRAWKLARAVSRLYAALGGKARRS